MKKNFLLLIVVLIVTLTLLVGCTANPKSQEGYQHSNSSSNASEHGAAVSNGNGNGNNANGDRGGHDATRNSSTGGYGNGQRIGNTDGDCNPVATDEAPAASIGIPKSESNEMNELAETDGFGASGALADEELTLANMLTYAIQDEYLAHAEYGYIMNTFGNVRPFSNIMKAEEQHIEQLLPLFSEYGMQAPADTGSDHAVAISDLAAAYQAGETAELYNIAMYDAFLKQDLPDDVRTVFESLRDASEKHLAAFRKHL